MNSQYLGSCLCQKVQFEIIGDFESFYLCHCSYCQKDTGSAHAANLFSSQAELKWLKGKEQIKTFNLAPTRHTKSFCMECGSALPTQHSKTQMIVVPAGSLDSQVDIKPNAHLFWSSKASWDNELNEVKKFLKLVK